MFFLSLCSETEGFWLDATKPFLSSPRTDFRLFFLWSLPSCCANQRQALSEEDCRNASGLFLREASETDLIKVVKSLDKTNRVPGGRSDSTSTGAYYSASPAWLVSRLTGGSGEGGGGAAEERGGEGGGRRGGVSPHALASALVYFLHRLPEPLLTFRRREAFLACEVGRGGRVSGFRDETCRLPNMCWAPLCLALFRRGPP